MDQPQSHPIPPDDPALKPGWDLLRFLLSIGGDEFSVSFLYYGKSKPAADRLESKLALFSLGTQKRENTVS